MSSLEDVQVVSSTSFRIITDKSGPGVFRAANQYGVREKVLDCLTFDVTRNPWRRGELLDAIITDPPCTPLLAD